MTTLSGVQPGWVGTKENPYDYIVIGGGISGLYAAWRLIENHKRNRGGVAFKLLLAEATDRFGGRIMNIGADGLGHVANIGAMRYLPDQPIINSLVAHLGRETKYGFSVYSHDFEPAYWHLRGRFMHFGRDPVGSKNDTARIVRDSLGRPNNLFRSNTGAYLLKDDECGLSPAELVGLALRRALGDIELHHDIHQAHGGTEAKRAIELKLRQANEASNGVLIDFHLLSPTEWRLFREHGLTKSDSCPLWKQSFWDILRRYVSHEAICLIHDGLGYQSIVGIWNAAEAIIWFIREFGAASNYKGIGKGMGRLPNALEKECGFEEVTALPADKTGAVSIRHAQATRVTYHEDCSLVSVEFSMWPEAAAETLVQGEVFAKNAVFAIPAGAIERIIWIPQQEDRDSPGPSPEAAELLLIAQDSVHRHALLKFFVWFDQNWWKDQIKSDAYKVFSDSELKQLYLYSGEQDFSGTGPAKAVMMAYADEAFAHYLGTLAKTFAGDAPLCKHRNEETSRLAAAYGVSARFWGRIAQSLEDVFPHCDSKLIHDSAMFVAFQDWTKAPYFAGWHSWRAGRKAWEDRQKIAQPFAGKPIYICGEAFSVEQGWIEGALRSTEYVLSQRIGLSPPEFGDIDMKVRELKFKNLADYLTF